MLIFIQIRQYYVLYMISTVYANDGQVIIMYCCPYTTTSRNNMHVPVFYIKMTLSDIVAFYSFTAPPYHILLHAIF